MTSELLSRLDRGLQFTLFTQPPTFNYTVLMQTEVKLSLLRYTQI